PGCQKACVLPENPASYRVVRTKSYLFNKATQRMKLSAMSVPCSHPEAVWTREKIRWQLSQQKLQN
ncbi:hypothetical protein, partial [Klebsiella pneumoniae]